MTGPIVYRLGEGALRSIEIDTRRGPVLAVALISENGPVPFNWARPVSEPATLVAVRLRHRLLLRRDRGKGRVWSLRWTTERKVGLGHGRILTYPTSPGRSADAVTVWPTKPGEAREGTWLYPDALGLVDGELVRLEAHRRLHTETPATDRAAFNYP
ncbi:hypothetical protein GCM10029992_36560 [Glycomyces albus]